MYRHVSFVIETIEQDISVYHSIIVEFKDNELLCKDGGGSFSLYLKDSYLCLEVDSDSKRIGGLSGFCPVNCMKKEIVLLPNNIVSGILRMDSNEDLLRGTGWRMEFDWQLCYDKKTHIMQIGKIDKDKPIFKCLANLYIQLKENNEMAGMLISDLQM